MLLCLVLRQVRQQGEADLSTGLHDAHVGPEFRDAVYDVSLALPGYVLWSPKTITLSHGRTTELHARCRETAVAVSVQETPSTSLQHDFVRVDTSDFCVQISRSRAEMINGPRRSRIGLKLTEIWASKVRKPPENPGVSWTLGAASVTNRYLQRTYLRRRFRP